jgi:hypothetical protein
VGVRATCPHCGGRTSRVWIEMRCSCGWADPVLHEPYQPIVHLDLLPGEARSALTDPAALLAEIGRQLDSPLVSARDGEPVLFTEPYEHRLGEVEASSRFPQRRP